MVDVKAVYRERIKTTAKMNVWDPLQPYNFELAVEKKRILARFLQTNFKDVSRLNVLDVGCGRGDNIKVLLDLGFSPEKIVGQDIMEEFIAIAKNRLPKSVELEVADATELSAKEKFDIVLQYVVFTSVIDDEQRKKIAHNIWQSIAPGGYLVSYDFSVNNPNNKDVKKLTVRELGLLFPDAELTCRRITVAPPLGRFLVNKYPFLYSTVAMLRIFSTHKFCTLRKANTRERAGEIC